MNRKFLALVLAVAMAFSLAACGQREPASSQGEGEEQQEVCKRILPLCLPKQVEKKAAQENNGQKQHFEIVRFPEKHQISRRPQVNQALVKIHPGR